MRQLVSISAIGMAGELVQAQTQSAEVRSAQLAAEQHESNSGVRPEALDGFVEFTKDLEIRQAQHEMKQFVSISAIGMAGESAEVRSAQLMAQQADSNSGVQLKAIDRLRGVRQRFGNPARTRDERIGRDLLRAEIDQPR